MNDQHAVPNHLRLQIDYERPGIPVSATILQPVVYKQDNKFHCLLGNGSANRVVGCGDTPESALQDWDVNLTRLLESPSADDELKRCVEMQLGQPNTGHATLVQSGQQGDLRYGVNGENIIPPMHAAVPALNAEQRKHTTDESNIDGSE